jgi:peptidyl-prolyl cis-trans isomerase SurA
MPSRPVACSLKPAASLLALAAFLLPAPARARVVDKVAAVVGNDIVLLSEVEHRMGPFRGEIDRIPDLPARQKRLEQLRKEALDSLVDERLMLQEADKLKISVTPDEIDKNIEQIKKDNSWSQAQLEQAVKNQGYKTYLDYRNDVRKQVLKFRIVGLQVRQRVNVSDDDVRAYYEQNVKSLDADAKVHARHIFFKLPAGAASSLVSQVMTKARQVAARARAGDDFAELAKKETEDPATRPTGGDLGSISRGSLPGHVEAVLFSMKVGEISEPIRTDGGVHVMKVVGRDAGSARPFSEVKEQVRRQLFEQELEKQLKLWLQDVRKKSFVDVRL